MSIRLWHVVPCLGLIATAVLIVRGSVLLAYGLFVLAGLVFVAEDFWQPYVRHPGYMRSLLTTTGLILALWPFRMAISWRQTAETLPQRFMVVDESDSPSYFAHLPEAKDFASKLATSSGRVACVFDRLTPQRRHNQLEAKVHEVWPAGTQP